MKSKLTDGQWKHYKNQRDIFQKNYQDIMSQFKINDEGKFVQDDNFDQKKFDEANKNFKAAEKQLEKILDRFNDKFDDDQRKQNPNKKGLSKFSYFMKLLMVLASMLAGWELYKAIKEYCANHSGCLKIMYTGSGFVQNNIEYCPNNQIPPNGSSSEQAYTWNPSLCGCFQQTGKPQATTDNNCTYGSTLEFTPDNTDLGGFPCDPPDGDIIAHNSKTYKYYSYIIMTPFDGALDIAHKAIDLGGDLLSKIVHAIIMIAIAIGVLFVLYIIIKLLSRRHEEFGRVSKSYLGNIGKFSHYGNSLALRPYSMKFR